MYIHKHIQTYKWRNCAIFTIKSSFCCQNTVDATLDEKSQRWIVQVVQPLLGLFY